ncbi:MAG: glycosyltransferase family 2 protein [Pseudomonadales bacterium]
MNTDNKSQRVSIVLPVYNGERYLRRAVDSIVNQTFTDFELIICDNASTDKTEDICREYAHHDERVHYHRHAENQGPNLNFSQGVAMASGEYFKWAAHDDEFAPNFLEACVKALEDNPQAILCQSLISIIDENGKQLAVYDSDLTYASASRQSARFSSLVLQPHVCTDLFGLIRLNALKKTNLLWGNYHGCDRALLAELALIGSYEKIAKPLFMNREHKQRYVRSILPSQRATHHNTALRYKTELSRLLLFRDYWRAIRSHAESRTHRVRCYWHLLRWWFVAWNSLRVGVELISRVHPPFYDHAKRLSDIIIAPQHTTVFSAKIKDSKLKHENSTIQSGKPLL